MTHFFLAQSHNNLCLSLAIILQEGLKNSHIIYLKKSNLDREFLYFFRNQMNEMGVTVSFPGEKNARSKADQKDEKVYGRRIKSTIKKLKRKKENGSYYFFDDRTIESQYVSSKVVKKNDKTYLVQDDMNFFVRSDISKSSSFKHFFKKIKHGFFLKDLTEVGDLRKYDGLYSLKPEFMLNKFKSLTKVHHLQSRALYSPQLRNIAAATFKQKYDDFFDFSEKETLVFLPKIENPEDITGIRVELLHKFASVKYPNRIFIKNHSHTKIFIKEQDVGHGIRFLPTGLPEICFFVFGAEKSLNYYMTPSANLLMAKLNLGSSKVGLINAGKGFTYENAEIQEFMSVKA